MTTQRANDLKARAFMEWTGSWTRFTGCQPRKAPVRRDTRSKLDPGVLGLKPKPRPQGFNPKPLLGWIRIVKTLQGDLRKPSWQAMAPFASGFRVNGVGPADD